MPWPRPTFDRGYVVVLPDDPGGRRTHDLRIKRQHLDANTTCERTRPSAPTSRAETGCRKDVQPHASARGQLVTPAVTLRAASRGLQERRFLKGLPGRPGSGRSASQRSAKATQRVHDGAGDRLTGTSKEATTRGHQPPPLGNNATEVSAQERARASRTLRYRLRETARPFQRNVNARKCGRVPYGGAVEIRLRVAEGTAHYHGLVRCGSWSSCPTCAAQIAAHRAAEVRQVADAHRQAGGALYLVTLTLPHDQDDRLELLHHAVVDSYRYVHGGDAWRRIKNDIAYVGEIRASECTIGKENGWHPHLHVLLFTSRRLASTELETLRAYMHRRWSKHIEMCGFRAPTLEHGITVVDSHRDDYLTKMGLADELAQGTAKRGHRESKTPLQVLADVAETHNEVNIALWREWTLAMHGTRQLTWSRGLRECYSQPPARSDLEIVGGESRELEKQVAIIENSTWAALVSAHRDIMWELLDAAETHGDVGVQRLLHAYQAAPSGFPDGAALG